MLGLVSEKKYDALSDLATMRLAVIRETHEMHDEAVDNLIGAKYDTRRAEEEYEKIAIENMHLKGKIASYEKTYNIRTKPWQDAIGRWRDPITGHCIKAPAKAETEAQLRKEIEFKTKMIKAQLDLTNAGGANNGKFGGA